VLKVVSADSEKQLGLIPTRVVVDELGSHPNDDLYTALRTALLKVPTSRTVVISAAAVHGEGPLWHLRERCLAQPEIRRDGVLTVARGEHVP
jgi:phage terminase large subunit-like protein